MERSGQLLNFWFALGLLGLVEGAVGAGFLQDTIAACTVGFRASGQPLGGGAASACPAYEILSALLIAVALAGGAMVVLGIVRFLWKNRSLGSGKADPGEREGTEGPGNHVPTTAEPTVGPSYGWVCLLIALFFAASFFAASWEYLRLSLNNFQDVATNQQALTSTILGGKPFPFYEAFNCGHHGQCSFLEVHPVFLAYAVVPLYSMAPTPFTLFAIQSLALGLGALPLYAVALDGIGSRRWAVVVAGVYLAWAPLFMGAFSFHWEAFIPVEMFTLFWLWSRQQYLLAAPIAILSFVTIDATTVLVFFMGIYFLWPDFVRTARRFFTDLRRTPEGDTPRPSRLRAWMSSLTAGLRVREVYASFLLMAGAVVAYVLLRLFVNQWGVDLGLPPLPAAYTLPLSSPDKDFVLSWAALKTLGAAKIWFWVVVFLTLGFIPILAPRALLLVLPWIFFTSFNVTPGYFHFGNQYLFVAAGALFIAFAFGLARIHRWIAARTAGTVGEASVASPPGSEAPEGDPSAPVTPGSVRRSGRPRPSAGVVILSVAIAVVIGGNLFLNPLDPLASPFVATLGGPFPSEYGVDLGPLPDVQDLQQLVSMIPKDAVVAAPLPVFSLVADDPYAYPLIHFANPPYNDSLLPDNVTARVQYVLLPYDTPGIDIPPTLFGTLYDRSAFGVRGCVASSQVGGAELFERGYNGTSKVFGAPDSLCPNYYAGGFGLTAEKYATVVANASSPSGVVVQSVPCNGAAPIWTGPGILLPRGQYYVHVVLDAFNSTDPACTGTSVNSTLPLVKLACAGPVCNPMGEHLRQSQLCSPQCGGWFYWNSTFSLSGSKNPVFFTGTVEMPQYVVQIAYLVIIPDSS